MTAMKVAVSTTTMRPALLTPARVGLSSSVKMCRVPLRTRAAMEEMQTSGENGSSKQAGTGLDFEELTDLIKMVHETDIVEFSLNSKKFKLAVKKKEALEAMEPQFVHVQAPSAPAPAMPAQVPVAQSAPAPAPAAAAAPPSARSAPAAPAAVDGVEIASPMAGTFYRSPAPGEPSFVNEGDRVTKGQTIGIIEAMKLMNEIEAEVSGTVVKIMADNGKPVTPGQTLLVIKP